MAMFQFLLIPLMGFIDSLCGGRPQVPGRGEYYAVPFLIVYMHFLIGWSLLPAVVFALLYWGYRACKPDQFGGSINPQNNKEYLGTLAKHSLAILLVAPLMIAGIKLGIHTIPLLLYPLAATLIAHLYSKNIAKSGVDKNYNNYEAIRGAILGLALCVAIV